MNDEKHELRLRVKFARELAKESAVRSMLKRIATLEHENKPLLEERDNAIKMLKESKPKKEWLKEDVIKSMQDEIIQLKKSNKETQAKFEEYMNKYYSLLNKND